MKHDEVVERLARAMSRVDESDDGLWKFAISEAKAALDAIQEGDSLGNGLWAAPIIASMKMTDAGRKVSRFGLGHIWDAMCRAAEGSGK